jgi:hypothetical protein
MSVRSISLEKYGSAAGDSGEDFNHEPLHSEKSLRDTFQICAKSAFACCAAKLHSSSKDKFGKKGQICARGVREQVALPMEHFGPRPNHQKPL